MHEAKITGIGKHLIYDSSMFRKFGMLTVMIISRLPTFVMYWSVNNANFALQLFAEYRPDPAFFHECSVTSKLEPN